MGLKWKTISADQLATAFQSASRDAKNDAFAVLREETYAIKDLSVKGAPVDTGDLEAAHRVVIKRNQSDKAAYEIVVSGGRVDDYVMAMHEGSYNLGPKSQLKQAAQSWPVGPKFLERAFNARVDILFERLMAAVWKGFTKNVG